MSEPTIVGHIELPVAYGSVEQVDEMLSRFGRRPGILVDVGHIRQSEERRSAAVPLRSKSHAVCYVLDAADWYTVTGEVSEYGGMICYLRA